MCTFHICLRRSLISTRFRCSVSRSIFPRAKPLSWAPRRASVRAFVRVCVICTHTLSLWRCVMHTIMHRGLCDGPRFVSLWDSVWTGVYVCMCVDVLCTHSYTHWSATASVRVFVWYTRVEWWCWANDIMLSIPWIIVSIVYLHPKP